MPLKSWKIEKTDAISGLKGGSAKMAMKDELFEKLDKKKIKEAAFVSCIDEIYYVSINLN